MVLLAILAVAKEMKIDLAEALSCEKEHIPRPLAGRFS